MTGFPNKVDLYPDIALPGQLVTNEDLVTDARGFLSDGTLVPGGFAFSNTAYTANDTRDPQGANFFYAGATVTDGEAQLVGLVVREAIGFVDLPTQGANNTYYAGANVSIALRGKVYAQVPEGLTPTEGQAVLCDPKTGAITYGASGAANDTGWRVCLLPNNRNAEGASIVIYQNFG